MAVITTFGDLLGFVLLEACLPAGIIICVCLLLVMLWNNKEKRDG